jgi:hypothetical protein
MQILLDFLNMPETVDDLRAFILKCGQRMLDLSPEDSSINSNLSKATKRIWFGGSVFSLIPKDHYDLYVTENTIFPEDQGHSSLWKELKVLRGSYILFIRTCHEGAPDLDFLCELLSEAHHTARRFVRSKDPFTPFLALIRPSPDTLQGLIAADILDDFINGRGIQYRRIVQCLNCGKWTLGKSTKIAYCSITCKSADHYRRRK